MSDPEHIEYTSLDEQITSLSEQIDRLTMDVLSFNARCDEQQRELDKCNGQLSQSCQLSSLVAQLAAKEERLDELKNEVRMFAQAWGKMQMLNDHCNPEKNACLKHCIQQLDLEFRDMQNRYNESYEEIKHIETVAKAKETELKNEIDVLNAEVSVLSIARSSLEPW